MQVEYIDHMGGDHSVVNAARVSFDKLADQFPQEKNDRLIRYLAKHKHFSPFNHTFITLKVKAPIFVARQLQKHEYMPWNEVSRRYVDSDPEFYMPDVWRSKAYNVKQGSGGPHPTWNRGVGTGYVDYITEHYLNSYNLYNEMINDGVAAEQARMVLPQSVYTEWYWSGTLKAWVKMCKLRLDPHAQQETRVIAEQCRKIIEPLFPVSLPALLESGVE